jgi:hypothetical protein
LGFARVSVVVDALSAQVHRVAGLAGDAVGLVVKVAQLAVGQVDVARDAFAVRKQVSALADLTGVLINVGVAVGVLLGCFGVVGGEALEVETERGVLAEDGPASALTAGQVLSVVKTVEDNFCGGNRGTSLVGIDIEVGGAKLAAVEGSEN